MLAIISKIFLGGFKSDTTVDTVKPQTSTRRSPGGSALLTSRVIIGNTGDLKYRRNSISTVGFACGVPTPM